MIVRGSHVQNEQNTVNFHKSQELVSRDVLLNEGVRLVRDFFPGTYIKVIIM